MSLVTIRVWGQPEFHDTLSIAIERLKAEKMDTVVQFDLPGYGLLRSDTLIGIGEVTMFQVHYLVYWRKGATFSQKFVEYCTKDCENLVFAVSLPLEIKEDTLIPWFRTHIDTILKEDIYPYIYLQRYKGVDHYDVFRPSHTPTYYIRICTVTEDIGKTVDDNDLQKEVRNFPENLNYETNRRTSLSILYHKLDEFFSILDKRFRF
ncbi:hypothetical protein [Puia dinghuensis]|uniref:Uncharacterized protein n=1 Tax=Puia dinghuensis TaxID=1792502 RepID=A0A8J2UJE4_9BACT|nr:hypothetical protein [Puia dinghuensis]GGB24375.1 hypothetical protein GCM10011511_55360 [Puia dinghuensis]